jgi:hypothetical protein
MYCEVSLHSINIQKTQSARDPAVAEFRWFAGQKGLWGLWVTQHWAFLGGRPARAEEDKNRPKPVADREIFLYHLSPRDGQKGEMLKPQRHQRERPQWEPNRGVWTHQRMSGVGCKQGDREDEYWPVTSSGWSWSELESESHQD